MNLRIKQSLPLIPGALPLKSGGAPETRGTRFPHIEDALRILDQGGEGGRSKSAGSRLEHVINQELSRDISEDREKLITTYFYKEEYPSKQIQIFHVDMHNLSCSHCNI